MSVITFGLQLPTMEHRTPLVQVAVQHIGTMEAHSVSVCFIYLISGCDILVQIIVNFADKMVVTGQVSHYSVICIFQLIDLIINRFN